MDDNAVVGRTGEPFEMVIELGRVRDFARATRSKHPDYQGGPGAVVVSPGTFLASALVWQTAANDPLRGVVDFERSLHGAQEYVFYGPPPSSGTVLRAQTRIDDVYEKPGNRGGSLRFIVSVTEFRDVTGALVAEAHNTTIETSKAATT